MDQLRLEALVDLAAQAADMGFHHIGLRIEMEVPDLLQQHGVKIAIYFIIALIAIDTLATYRYKLALNENIEVQAKLDAIANNKGTIISNLNNIDMSLRGYLLVQNEAFIGTYEKIKSQSRPTMVFLEANLPKIGIPATELEEMKKMLDDYFKLMDQVIVLTRDSSMTEALKIIKEAGAARK